MTGSSTLSVGGFQTREEPNRSQTGHGFKQPPWIQCATHGLRPDGPCGDSHRMKVEASAHGSYKAIFVVVVAWLAWLAKARMGQTPKTKASHVTHDPLAGAQNIYSENKESCERGFCINRFGRVLVANGILRSTPATSLCGTGYDV